MAPKSHRLLLAGICTGFVFPWPLAPSSISLPLSLSFPSRSSSSVWCFLFSTLLDASYPTFVCHTFSLVPCTFRRLALDLAICIHCPLFPLHRRACLFFLLFFLSSSSYLETFVIPSAVCHVGRGNWCPGMILRRLEVACIQEVDAASMG